MSTPEHPNELRSNDNDNIQATMTDNGTFQLQDPDNSKAWIESTLTVNTGDMW